MLKLFQKKTYTCPVCGYTGLTEPPCCYSICSCCSTQFENDDDMYSVEELRWRWVEGGMQWWSQGDKEPRDYNPQKQLQDLLTVKLKRRSWFGRLLQLPKVFLSDYAMLRKGNGRIVSTIAALRLASFMVTPMPSVHVRFTESKDVFKNINGEDVLGVDRGLDSSKSPFVRLDNGQATIKRTELIGLKRKMDKYKKSTISLDEWIAQKPDTPSVLGTFTTSDGDAGK